MSRKGLRQWAAVRRTRGLNTRAEQKPALSPPRISTIATRSAKRLSGSAPTSARAGASGAASAAANVSDRRKRESGDVIALASCARRRRASIARPGSRRFSARFRARRPVRASIARLDHSHCIQPQAPTWGIKYSQQRLCRHGARHALPRRGLVGPHALGGLRRWGGVRLSGMSAAQGRRSRSAPCRGEAGLSQRRRDARDWSNRVTCSSRSRRSSSPAPNARPRRCRRSSAAPETISFTRSPSCIGTGASCMSRWRLGRGKSLRARPVSRTKLTNPTSRTNLTRPTSRPPRIDFGGNQG